MDAKISVTTFCNAKCKTCPVWSLPGNHIKYDDFIIMWDKLMKAPEVSRILLNNTGDMYVHPKRREIFRYIEEHKYKPVIMTTNGAAMDYVPKIDYIVISFNGGTKETYEYTTGLDFDRTVKTIKSFYSDLRRIPCEIDCLIWEGNKGTEKDLEKLWSDFPGRIRISYKYDNQMKEDYTLKEYKRESRMYCDYLNMLSIMPNGQVVSCAHDFEMKTNWGNVLTDSVSELIVNKNRQKKQAEHRKGIFTGLCEKCNYNTSIVGKIRYVR